MTVAARNRRLALPINILSRASYGAVPVAEWDIKGDSPCLVRPLRAKPEKIIVDVYAASPSS
jgi:hypothetical protein